MVKYKLIAKKMAQDFEKQRTSKNTKLPTEEQLRQQYNVSRVTIRAALQLLKDEGLVTQIQGKGTFYTGVDYDFANQSKTIALVVLNSNAEIAKIVQGVSDALDNPNYKINTYITNGESEKEQEIIDKAIADGADGILIFPTNENDTNNYFSRLLQDNFPIVFLDRSPSRNSNIVQSNNELGMYKITEFLVKNGHKNIAYISNFDISVLKDRYSGFIHALNDNQIEFKKSNLIVLDKSPTSISDNPTTIYAKIENLLKNRNIPSAIVCANDIIALHVITKLRSLGEPYSSISVTGFDNAIYASRNAFSITTIEQDFFKIGKEATNLLIDILNKKNQNITQIKIPVKLIVRDSVKCIK